MTTTAPASTRPTRPTRSGPAGPGGPGGPDGADTAGTTRVVTWLAVLVAVVVALVVATPDQPPPYAITSEAPGGTDVLRRVVDDLGVDMVEGEAGEVIDGLTTADVAVVFRDQLTGAQERRVQEHVLDGGRLVVAAPGSTLAGGRAPVPGIGASGPPGCDLLPARAVISLDVDLFEGRDATLVPDLVDVGPGADQACWEADGQALVATWDGLPGLDPARASDGVGRTVVLGDPDVVTNAAILAEPNLGQLAALFLPAGDGRVVVLVGTEVPPAAVGPVGSVPANLRRGMWLAALALALFAAGRARRHGRVVAESPPVEVPASALAGGIAELLERHGQSGDAASRLRAELRAELGPRLGSGDRDPAVLVPLAVHATGLGRAVVARALDDEPVHGDADLLAVAAAGRAIRAALDADRSAGPGHASRPAHADDLPSPDDVPGPDATDHPTPP